MSANSCYLNVIRFAALVLVILIPVLAAGQAVPEAHLSAFGAGDGPSHAGGAYRLLDRVHTPGQSNAVGFNLDRDGEYEQIILRCGLRVLAGGDGGAFVFLNTAAYGRRGSAPFVKSWVEPNFTGTFAVGIDVHNPPGDDPFDAWGNYRGMPEREVSLHWDGREIVKRVVPVEFRGDFAKLEIFVQHVIGGAEVTLMLAGATVYDRYFLAGMLPYEMRLAIGAGTREDAATEFDVQDIEFIKSQSALPRRPPNHFKIFNHVMTSGTVPSYEKEVTLPELHWAYGRVILTLEIHDSGPEWDGWDRNGYFYVTGPDGVKRDIVPFITSFQTPWQWKVDVTHFRPWLAGKVKLEIAVEHGIRNNQGYMLSASLDFYHGMPELEPFRIQPLWLGTAKYKSPVNHFSDFFTPQEVKIDALTRVAALYLTTTGHSLVGEFTPSRRTVIFTPEKGGDPASKLRFENLLWKSDNYLNPNRPQFGSWKYSRAGWAPGDVVHPWWVDLTAYIVPGRTAELRYEPEPYDFSNVHEDQRPTDDQVNRAIHLVRAYLVLYRSPLGLLPAPFLHVLSVEEESNASRAGIQPGDYLESYDGRRPESIAELRELIRVAEAAGKKAVEVVIYRGAARIGKETGPGRMGVLLEEI